MTEDLNSRIRLFAGAVDFSEPLPEPEQSTVHRGLLLILLCGLSWALFAGVGYCLYRAAEAVMAVMG